MTDFEPIVGRYRGIDIAGETHRIFIEEAGSGIPLLCLHTAGNDSRQFRHLLNDPAITGRFRVVAFDMPFHGRSTPPDRWWLRHFRLTTQSYLDIIRAAWCAPDVAPAQF
jgi:pimeloyl-ACP methyl ester carboxylesterase